MAVQPVLDPRARGPILNDPNIVAAPPVDFGTMRQGEPAPEPPPILAPPPDPRIVELDTHIAQLWKRKSELAQSGYGFGDAIIGTKPKEMAMLDQALSSAIEARKMYLPDAFNQEDLAARRNLLRKQGTQIGQPYVSGPNRVVPFARDTGELHSPVLGSASVHETTISPGGGALYAAAGTPSLEEVAPSWKDTDPERPLLLPSGGMAIMPSGERIQNPRTFRPETPKAAKAAEAKEAKLPSHLEAKLKEMTKTPVLYSAEFEQMFGPDWILIQKQDRAAFDRALEAKMFEAAGMEPPARLKSSGGKGSGPWQQTPGGTKFRPAH